MFQYANNTLPEAPNYLFAILNIIIIIPEISKIIDPK